MEVSSLVMKLTTVMRPAQRKNSPVRSAAASQHAQWVLQAFYGLLELAAALCQF